MGCTLGVQRHVKIWMHTSLMAVAAYSLVHSNSVSQRLDNCDKHNRTRMSACRLDQFEEKVYCTHVQGYGTLIYCKVYLSSKENYLHQKTPCAEPIAYVAQCVGMLSLAPQLCTPLPATASSHSKVFLLLPSQGVGQIHRRNKLLLTGHAKLEDPPVINELVLQFLARVICSYEVFGIFELGGSGFCSQWT